MSTDTESKQPHSDAGHRVRRLATLLHELYSDIEQHRFLLCECERKRQSFCEERKSDGQLSDRALIAWHRHSAVIDASHKRIDRHLTELLPLTDGIATDLRFGLADQAGPVATRLVRALKCLHDDFHPRAINQIEDRQNGTCGYLWWYFDGGLHDSFKKWWEPIAIEVHEVAGILRAVAIDESAEDYLGGSLQGTGLSDGGVPVRMNNDPDPLAELQPYVKVAVGQYYEAYKQIANSDATAGQEHPVLAALADKSVTDRQVYEQACQNQAPEDGELPCQSVWTSYVRKARNVMGAQKHKPRNGRPHGGSVVNQGDIDPL